MHHKIFHLPSLRRLAPLMALLLLLIAASCSRSNNMGKIHAMWQVMSIERPDCELQTDFSPRLYYCFDQGVLQLNRSSDDTQSQGWYAANVTGEDPDYILDFPYDYQPVNLDRIRPWGIDENPVAMKVLRLDGNTLVMQIGENVITCRRF